MNRASDDRGSKHFAEEIKVHSMFCARSAPKARRVVMSTAAAAAAFFTAGAVISLALNNNAADTADEQHRELLDEISYIDARITDAQNLAAAATASRAMGDDIEIPRVAYSLRADGKTVAVLASEDEINSVLSAMKKNAVNDHKGAKAEFAENIEILEGIHTQDEIITADEFKRCLSEKAKVSKTYTVKSKDTRESIAKYYGISVESLEKLNPEIKGRKMKAGDKLNIVYDKKPITVKLTLTDTSKSEIKFSKKTVENSALSTSYKKVTTKGENGEKEVTAKITYIDGREVSKEILSENIISEAVDEITTVGTNNSPGASLGRFSWPLPNFSTLTSEFGPRWGRNHNGIDISGGGVYGADIVASDGGEVILAQEDDSGYGMHIIIDHGNGYQTQYAHCSELFVSVGDMVDTGQTIAAVGSTGNSTGPHLHFEIIKDGTKVDPLPYLK